MIEKNLRPLSFTPGMRRDLPPPDRPDSGTSVEFKVWDDSGGLSVLMYGRRQIAGIQPGARIRLEGMVGRFDGHLAMANPTYELLPEEPEAR